MDVDQKCISWVNSIMEIVFWGMGKIGQAVLTIWNSIGLQPTRIVDKNIGVVGNTYCGFIIESTQIVKSLKKKEIYITCYDGDRTVRKEIIDMGIKDDEIIDYYDIPIVLGDALNRVSSKNCDYMCHSSIKTVLFDMQNGDILGGVETWSHFTMDLLQEKSMPCKMLTCESDSIADELKKAVSIIESETPCCVISNFERIIFWSACIVKYKKAYKMKLVAVIHNDLDFYYNSCLLFQNYIDECLVISNRMEEKMLNKGFPRNKLKKLNWGIDKCALKIEKRKINNGMLSIGYAGRLEFYQKRIDILCDVIKEICKLNINIIFEIAGDGEGYSYIDNFICSEKINNHVKLLGEISHNDIYAFWKRQDIMISTSLLEGHSLTQFEAMSMGAVPIITDVSGASDDIEDGKCGYIIAQKDKAYIVSKMVEYICHLDNDREKLFEMSNAAQDQIISKSDKKQIIQLWSDILGI